MKTPHPTISLCQGAVALSLLLGVVNATALTKTEPPVAHPAPAKATASVTPAAPAPDNLTPTAPTTSPASLAAEDIRDIRQPRHLPPNWFWAAIAVGVLSLCAIAYAAWRWIRHGRFFVLQPYEIALQGLEEARRLMDPDHAREYCFEVSNIIRRYLEQQFHLQSPQLTTEEFLRELVEVRETRLVPQRATLGDFLQHCDLAKFAGWRYCRPDLEAMHISAVQFVRQTTPTGADAGENRSPSAPEQNHQDTSAANLPRVTTA